MIDVSALGPPHVFVMLKPMLQRTDHLLTDIPVQAVVAVFIVVLKQNEGFVRFPEVSAQPDKV